MNKNIKLLMFDLDGTIADTLPSIREAVNLTLEHFGKPTRSYDEICEAIGNGALVLIRKSFSSDKMFAVIILISVISLVLIWLTSVLQKVCMPWERVNKERK